MGSCSNGWLSDDNVSDEQPLDIGRIHKKPRKLSATREFPPGCGPNAVRINLKTDENCGGDAVSTEIEDPEMQNVVSLETTVKCQSYEEVRSSCSLTFGQWAVVNGSADVPENVTLDELMDKAKENVSHSKKLIMEIGPLGTQLSEEAEWHKQGRVNNPIDVKRDEPVDPCMGKVMTAVIDGLPNEVKGLTAEPDLVGVEISYDVKILNQSGGHTMSEIVKEDHCLDSLLNSSVEVIRYPLHADASIDKDLLLRSSLELPTYSGSLLPEISIRPKDKYRPRKVSAVRYFPPNCGTSAYLKENDMSTPRKDSLNSRECSPEEEEDHGTSRKCLPEVTPISMLKADVGNSDKSFIEPVRNNIGVCSPGDSDEGRNSHNAFGSNDDVDREVLQGLVAAPFCQLKKEKTIGNSNGGICSGKEWEYNLFWRQKAKAVAKKSNPFKSSSLPSKRKRVHVSNYVDEGTHALMLPDVGDDHNEDFATNSPTSNRGTHFEISLPRFGPTRSDLDDARNRVKRALQYFHIHYRKLLQQEEANPVQRMEGTSKKSGRQFKRHDISATQALKNNGQFVNTTKMIGPLPGVEVGDEFQYRVELSIVGIHSPYQSGIDTVKVNGVPLASSIVTSGAYSDDVENADVLLYCGHGGNVIGSKQPEDQKLERGNLALKNCIAAKTPVRVVRGWKEIDHLDAGHKPVTTYVYDGLYTVTNYWTEKGPHGKQVFMFELKRNPGQPELAWKELKKLSRSKIRTGVCVTDISGGKERVPISAVNTLDNDKPPRFIYTPNMIYPDWYSPHPPDGCSCTERCSQSQKCFCAARNEGSIPYNHNGALVETKPLVYECGPHCKCPPSCYNRVSQRGIKLPLEVFKTHSRGWGVRALASIPSGSFICEYSGELLEDKIADERIGHDEYLFDVGQNLIDSSTNPEEEAACAQRRAERGYTIDALKYGNVGRFINHSCLPNLYAQNVIYDNDDKRMPHIMLFAVENIPPLTELTYHYNYSVGQIQDSHGNVKVKKCYCGAVGCSGRMY